MNTQVAYLFGSLFLLLIWLALYLFHPVSRKKILIVSSLTALFGLTEPLFVPNYWFPPTLFNLAVKTGFDLESLIFSFAIGGVGSVLYESLWPLKRIKLSSSSRHLSRHKFHKLALSSPVITFLFLGLFTSLNPIYLAIISLFVGALATFYCRPDLKRSMLKGGLIFTLLYLVVFYLFFVLLLPTYVSSVWNLSALSGLIILGIPLEELLFAASFGAMWSSVYEHLNWYRYV